MILNDKGRRKPMKRASAFLLCVLMILSFCACSDRKNGASSSSVAPPPAPAKSGFSTKELMLSEIPRAQAVSDDTLAAVSPGGGKWGYIGKDGSFAIEPIYLDAGDFSSGVAAVAVSDTEKGILYGTADLPRDLLYDRPLQPETRGIYRL